MNPMSRTQLTLALQLDFATSHRVQFRLYAGVYISSLFAVKERPNQTKELPNCIGVNCRMHEEAPKVIQRFAHRSFPGTVRSVAVRNCDCVAGPFSSRRIRIQCNEQREAGGGALSK